MISEASRHCRVELQALPARIGQVRRIVSAQLRYWHLDPLIDHAALGVTELLTNVHRHAQPDKLCAVELELLLNRLTISVHDHDPRLPTAGSMGDRLETTGRGLALIAALSESWGVRPKGEGGKAVWFTLPAPLPLAYRPTFADAVVCGASVATPLASDGAGGISLDEPFAVVDAGRAHEVREPAVTRSAAAR
ncbi:ATP-binding protein [Streptomyces sp. NPDC127084]|uniref:ATP-binding protein n=1 Tax=Streptomyces sp. NPDC127084 TaxID=3347133 RepID=UPI0036624877